MIMKVGPTHYEGWTCIGCEQLEGLEYIEGTDYRCKETKEFITEIKHTPLSCPYLMRSIGVYVNGS